MFSMNQSECNIEHKLTLRTNTLKVRSAVDSCTEENRTNILIIHVIKCLQDI